MSAGAFWESVCPLFISQILKHLEAFQAGYRMEEKDQTYTQSHTYYKFQIYCIMCIGFVEARWLESSHKCCTVFLSPPGCLQGTRLPETIPMHLKFCQVEYLLLQTPSFFFFFFYYHSLSVYLLICVLNYLIEVGLTHTKLYIFNVHNLMNHTL